MEMSMGTIVTIILLVVVLVLGIFFIQRIFETGTNAIDQIDTQVQNEINKLFTEEGKKVVIFPSSREITIKQGDFAGFGVSIRNINRETGEKRYSYVVKATNENDCGLSTEEADSYIRLGGTYSTYLGSGNTMAEAEIVKFSIPESAPLCLIRYKVIVQEDGQSYVDISVDLQIK